MISAVASLRLSLCAALAGIVLSIGAAPASAQDAAAPAGEPSSSQSSDEDDEDDQEDEGNRATETRDSSKKARKSPVTVRGCLHGTTLGHVEAEEDIQGLTSSVSLRASRDMRKRMKPYDKHLVEITGILTPAPKSPLSGRWGGTTVSIGGADPRRPIGQPPPTAVASIEVESIRSVASSCK